jgi:hypothetical protein
LRKNDSKRSKIASLFNLSATLTEGNQIYFQNFSIFTKNEKMKNKLGCVFRNSNRLQQLTVRKDLFFNESPVTGECGIKFKTK